LGAVKELLSSSSSLITFALNQCNNVQYSTLIKELANGENLLLDLQYLFSLKKKKILILKILFYIFFLYFPSFCGLTLNLYD
jgi:hypothetical protein